MLPLQWRHGCKQNLFVSQCTPRYMRVNFSTYEHLEQKNSKQNNYWEWCGRFAARRNCIYSARCVLDVASPAASATLLLAATASACAGKSLRVTAGAGTGCWPPTCCTAWGWRATCWTGCCTAGRFPGSRPPTWGWSATCCAGCCRKVPRHLRLKRNLLRRLLHSWKVPRPLATTLTLKRCCTGGWRATCWTGCCTAGRFPGSGPPAWGWRATETGCGGCGRFTGSWPTWGTTCCADCCTAGTFPSSWPPASLRLKSNWTCRLRKVPNFLATSLRCNLRRLLHSWNVPRFLAASLRLKSNWMRRLRKVPNFLATSLKGNSQNYITLQFTCLQ